MPKSYLIFWWLIMIFLKRVEVKGREFLRKEGGVIIAALHPNSFDPFFLAPLIARERKQLPYFIVDERVNKWLPSLLLKFLSKHFGLLIKQSSGDLKIIEKAKEKVKEGFAVVFYFQGGRVGQKTTQKPKIGAILTSLQTNAPVLPVWIEARSHRSFKQGVKVIWGILFKEKIKIIIGPPCFFHIDYDREHKRDFFKKLRRSALNLQETVQALGSLAKGF